MKATEKTGGLACLRMTNEDEDLLLVRDDGVIMRMPVDQISIIGRNTQGVRLMSLDGETKIASVALLPHQEIVPDEDETAAPEATAEAPAPETNAEAPEGEE
jgi:DNA gyrase subunit A